MIFIVQLLKSINKKRNLIIFFMVGLVITSLCTLIFFKNDKISNLKEKIKYFSEVNESSVANYLKDKELIELLLNQESFTDYDSPDFKLKNIKVIKDIKVDQSDLNFASEQNQNWYMSNSNYNQDRYYVSDDINTNSVKNLKHYLTIHTGVRAANQSSPIVVNGIMFISTAFNNIYAFDAKNGNLFWHFKYKNYLGPYNYYNCCGPNNRGLAIKEGKIFMATLDAHLVCIDAKTGNLLWDKNLLENENIVSKVGYGAVAAPVIFENKVLIGIVDGDWPIRAFIKSYDLETGKLIWTFYTIPEKGQEGVWQTKDLSGRDLGRDIEKEKELFAKSKIDLNLGGGIWNSPSIDINSRTIFFTTGNPYPDFEGDKRPGDNLYTDSILAIDLDSGKYKWHVQYIPHDIWDLDFGSTTILVDTKDAEGKKVPAVVATGKIGNIFVHNRANGKIIKISQPMIPQNLWKKSTHLYGMGKDSPIPDVHSGVSWSPMAYSRKLNYVYALNSVKSKNTNGDDYHYSGRLAAVSIDTGEIAWKIDTKDPLVGAPLVTSGNVLFYGEGNGLIHAVNAVTGEKLWQYQCDAGANGGFSAYKIEKKQYLAIFCGGEMVRKFKRGNKIHIFSLSN